MLPARQSLQADIHNWLGQFLPRRNVFCLYNSIFSILGLAQRGLGVILAPNRCGPSSTRPAWPTAPLWSLATNPGFSWSSAGGG